MAELVTTLIWVVPIAAIFGVVLSNKRIYNAVDAILNNIFEKFD